MLKALDARAAMKMTATRPVMIITTRHASGIVNAGVFGSYTNLSADQIGIAVGTESHTYANIMRDRQFVINIPGRSIVAAVKTLAEEVPADRSELDDAGLTAEPGSAIEVPHIAECVGAVECVFEQEVPIGYHSFIIGRAQGGFGREEFILPDGRLDALKAGIFHCHRYPEDLYLVFGEEIAG